MSSRDSSEAWAASATGPYRDSSEAWAASATGLGVEKGAEALSPKGLTDRMVREVLVKLFFELLEARVHVFVEIADSIVVEYRMPTPQRGIVKILNPIMGGSGLGLHGLLPPRRYSRTV